MPMVNGKKFPYTAKGKKAAKSYAMGEKMENGLFTTKRELADSEVMILKKRLKQGFNKSMLSLKPKILTVHEASSKNVLSPNITVVLPL